jgi:hypothetical protein
LASAWSDTQEQFKETRALMHMVERQSCEDYSQYHDLYLFSKLFKELTGGSVSFITTEAEKRVVRMVSQVTSLAVVSPGEVRSSTAYNNSIPTQVWTKLTNKKRLESLIQLPYREIDPDYITIAVNDYPYFSGKIVAFFGESPLILGRTAIMRASSSTIEIDCAFVREARSIPLALKAKEIWVKSSVSVLGYERGKMEHYGYVQWRRVVQLYIPPIRESKPESAIMLRKKTVIQVTPDEELLKRFERRKRKMIAPEIPIGVDLYYDPAKIFGSTGRFDNVPTVTQKLHDVLNGHSLKVQKSVECFVREHLQKEMDPERFLLMVKNTYGGEFDTAVKHLIFLRDNGLIDQTSQSIVSKMK